MYLKFLLLKFTTNFIVNANAFILLGLLTLIFCCRYPSLSLVLSSTMTQVPSRSTSTELGQEFISRGPMPMRLDKHKINPHETTVSTEDENTINSKLKEQHK